MEHSSSLYKTSKNAESLKRILQRLRAAYCFHLCIWGPGLAIQLYPGLRASFLPPRPLHRHTHPGR
jgi:hypothetical protein